MLDSFRVKITIELSDERKAQAIHKALLPETLSQANASKGKVEVNSCSTHVAIVIVSKDIGDLTALVNSYLYLIASALRALELTKE